MTDVFPVDQMSPVGRVRKYIPDLIPLPDPANPSVPASFIFSDDEIAAFLAEQTDFGVLPLTGFRIRRAAGYAMIALANSENLILKKIITQDQQTDGPSVAKQLIAAAAVLINNANADEANQVETATPDGLLAVFPPQPTHPFSYRQRWLR